LVPPQVSALADAQDSVSAEDSWTIQVRTAIIAEIKFGATSYQEW
jgi:hypothetical protein